MYGDTELRDRIVTRAADCMARCRDLCRERGASLPEPQIRFDLRGQAAGQCIWRRGRAPVLRFNLDLAQANSDDFLTTTVAHEVAHLATYACHGRTRPHGPQWRAFMHLLGIERPRRCHDYPVDDASPRRQRRWSYRCDCRLHELSTTRHNRVQRHGVEYRCRACGTRLRAVDEN